MSYAADEDYEVYQEVVRKARKSHDEAVGLKSGEEAVGQ